MRFLNIYIYSARKIFLLNLIKKNSIIIDLLALYDLLWHWGGRLLPFHMTSQMWPHSTNPEALLPLTMSLRRRFLDLAMVMTIWRNKAAAAMAPNKMGRLSSFLWQPHFFLWWPYPLYIVHRRRENLWGKVKSFCVVVVVSEAGKIDYKTVFITFLKI